MPRQGVTYDEVAAIADQILAGGLEPTVRNVRDRLRRGSPNTIHKHLITWRSARPPAVPAVPELPASLLQEIAKVLSRAVAEARAEVEARLVQALTEADELSTAGEELEAEQERLQGCIGNITAQRDALSVEVEAQASDIVRLTSEVERERQATDLARTEVAHTRLGTEAQAEKISEQAADIARRKAEREIEAKARIAAEQASAVKDARLEAMQQLLDTARHDIERLAAQVDLERQNGSTGTGTGGRTAKDRGRRPRGVSRPQGPGREEKAWQAEDTARRRDGPKKRGCEARKRVRSVNVGEPKKELIITPPYKVALGNCYGPRVSSPSFSWPLLFRHPYWPFFRPISVLFMYALLLALHRGYRDRSHRATKH
jgi:hypothetical protein